MKLDSFMPVRIVSGRGCVSASAELFKKLGTRCLIVTGGSAAAKSGALADVTAVFDAAGIAYSVFSSVGQNPKTSVCCDAGAAARSIGADFITGIGGGSPLDAAKAAAVYAANPDLLPDDIYSLKSPIARLPVVLVGTSAGTGSEVTGVSVLTNSLNRKKSVSGADYYAQTAFCDYSYTATMPYLVTVSTALDALAHAVEAYLGNACNALTENYVFAALPLLWKNLVRFSEKPEIPADNVREELYMASLFAGLAINISGTAFCHTVGYILTEEFGIPHGRACTAFMPVLTERAARYCPEKLDKMLNLLGIDKDGFLNVIGKLTDVRITVSAEQAAAFAERWSGSVKNFVRTPGGFTPQDAAQALSGL